VKNLRVNSVKNLRVNSVKNLIRIEEILRCAQDDGKSVILRAKPRTSSVNVAKPEESLE
jgi:hypothetical protein